MIMKKYKKVEVSEREFEDIIRLNSDLVEDGLKYIDHQKRTDRGPLDVLMVDSGNALVVAELKVSEDDGMLVQGLDYYDFCLRNLEGLARAYSKFNIDTNQDPRLLLIAPSFSINLRNRCKWVNVPISLYAFQCIKFEENVEDVIPIFKDVSIPSFPQKIERYDIKDRLNYITNAEMRKLAKETIDEIKKWDDKKILIEPTKYDISIKVLGNVFAYLNPRRNFFSISTYDPEGKWTGYQINQREDLEETLALVKLNYEKKR